MSNPSRPRKQSTLPFHKPDCACIPCSSRRRKAEAFALAAREGRTELEPFVQPIDAKKVLNADLDPIYMQGRTARDRVAQWLSLRALEPGITNVEVAKRLGIAANSLNTLLVKARKAGWLKFENPMERVEFELVPKVIDNLSEFLDQKDKTVTIETAKGTLFKDYEKSKGIGEVPQTVLALKIETIDPANVKVMSGQIVGVPRQLEE